ncbi:MAG: GDSL-type esterase/lipase family protein [Gemmatimonas sp.]
MTELRICFVGDSITQGTLDDTALGWPGRLIASGRRKGHDLTGYNLGIRRDTSKDIERRWKAEVEARLPSTAPGAVVFMFGINDMQSSGGELFRVPPPESVKVARAMVTEAKAKWPVLWLSPVPPVPGHKTKDAFPDLEEDYINVRAKKLVEAYAHVARELDVPFLDLYTPLAARGFTRWRWLRALKAGDGIHPKASGYALLASLIERWDGWQEWLEG